MGVIRGVGLRKEGRGKHPTEIMRGGEGVVNPYRERGFQRWQKMPKRGKGCVRNDRLKMVVICSDPPPYPTNNIVLVRVLMVRDIWGGYMRRDPRK